MFLVVFLVRPFVFDFYNQKVCTLLPKIVNSDFKNTNFDLKMPQF